MQLTPITIHIPQKGTEDNKLQMLHTNLLLKIAMPFNEGNLKVLVFTFFSDTAVLLYNKLASTILKETQLHVGLVTNNTIKCTIPNIKPDFDTILTLFSPKTKAKDKILPNVEQEIDVLFATDCIPKEENLQDCDCLINYEAPENQDIMDQRIGFIDKKNSPSEKIRVVNYYDDSKE